MSRVGCLQVGLPLAIMVAVQSLADRESRSLSNMGAALIREALAARAEPTPETTRAKRLADANHMAAQLKALLRASAASCLTCRRALALVTAYLDGEK